MPTHWTYSSFDGASDLVQGDIIKRSDEVLQILNEAHRHFANEKYIAYAVLTQSCDLVCRGEACKAKYITLAVIRELDHVLPEMVADVCGTEAAGVYAAEKKLLAQQLLTRVVNQNEQAAGLFYLHPDGDAGIAAPSVVLLRVSIALRRSHYEVLRRARCGRIGGEFSAKLGWLTGNLYSRVATSDWDDHAGMKSLSSYVDEILESSLPFGRQSWVPSKWVENARAAGIDFSEIQLQDPARELERYAPPNKLDSAVDRVSRTLLDVLCGPCMSALVERLSGDDRFVGAASARIASIVCANEDAEKVRAVESALASDASVRRFLATSVHALLRNSLKEQGAEAFANVRDLMSQAQGLIPPAVVAVGRALQALPHGYTIETAQVIRGESIYDEEAAARVEYVVNEHVPRDLSRTLEMVRNRLSNDGAFRAQF